MASNNTTPNTITNLFLDNVVGNITASDLRAFAAAAFSNNEVVINKFKTLSAFETGDVSTIYENSIVLITEDTDINSGVYISKTNQPSSVDLLTQISNNVTSETLTKTVYEFTAFENQYQFTGIEYKDNLIDVFVDGSKIRHSQITTNSSESQNGTVVILSQPVLQDSIVEIICFS